MNTNRLVPRDFFLREDVVAIAKELIGKELLIETPQGICGGIITETEAYKAPEDKASHAYNNKRTPRTEIFFAEGGCLYVYLCYGMHYMLNIVTGPKDLPHAILIRAIKPTQGIPIIKENRGNVSNAQLTNGPGKVCKALGIDKSFNEIPINVTPVYILESELKQTFKIKASKRIGIDYAQEYKDKMWRFTLED
jgi:DNA-3-methyladenine glycosylase